MIILPIETEGHRHDALIVILAPDNLARMKQGDPAEVKLSNVRKAGKQLKDPAIYICYEEPSPKFNRLIQSGDLRTFLEYLQRGWKFRPKLGDNDAGPRGIHEGN